MVQRLCVEALNIILDSAKYVVVQYVMQAKQLRHLGFSETVQLSTNRSRHAQRLAHHSKKSTKKNYSICPSYHSLPRSTCRRDNSLCRVKDVANIDHLPAQLAECRFVSGRSSTGGENVGLAITGLWVFESNQAITADLSKSRISIVV